MNFHRVYAQRTDSDDPTSDAVYSWSRRWPEEEASPRRSESSQIHRKLDETRTLVIGLYAAGFGVFIGTGMCIVLLFGARNDEERKAGDPATLQVRPHEEGHSQYAIAEDYGCE